MREDLTQRRFIEETYRIISTEGREALSIRRLARDMHCNSANIYRYFKDLDELVTYASLRYLTAYLGDVAVLRQIRDYIPDPRSGMGLLLPPRLRKRPNLR